MGLFKRLIGKGTEVVKKIIGKGARAVHGVIGKAEQSFDGFKKSLPQGHQNFINALSNDPHFMRDTKSAYRGIKNDLKSTASDWDPTGG